MSSKIKLLYVDDEDINLQIFKINFSERFEVYLASDGTKGLKVLQEYKDIMVVISDMKMPGINGIEFIKKAKSLYSEIKFFILTGFAITDEIQKSLNSGLIVKYFMKPFNYKEFEDTVSSLFKK